MHGAIWQDQDKIATSPERCVQCGACAEVCLAEARQMMGREMSVPQVMAEIERDVAFYDESGGGVTCSGGEPLLQPDFLRALLEACREREIHTALDTSGFAAWEVIESIRAYVDLFLYDLKLVDDARHRRFVGVSSELILQNARALAARGHRLVLRIPIIPGINDDDGSVCQLGAFARELRCLNGIDLLPYHHIGAEKYARLHKPYLLPDARPPLADRMAAIAKILQGFGLKVKIV